MIGGVLMLGPFLIRLAYAKGMATPTMNIKKGCIKSQKCSPRQAWWLNWVPKNCMMPLSIS